MLREDNPSMHRQSQASYGDGILTSGECGHGYDLLREEVRRDGVQKQSGQESFVEEVILIDCSLPVPKSFAETATIPLLSILNVT